MSRMSEHHQKLNEHGEGKCSVPMWCNGMPAGFFNQLIVNYVDAAIDESWKGGGDPANVETLELRMKLTREELSVHIGKMKREEEP